MRDGPLKKEVIVITLLLSLALVVVAHWSGTLAVWLVERWQKTDAPPTGQMDEMYWRMTYNLALEYMRAHADVDAAVLADVERMAMLARAMMGQRSMEVVLYATR